MHLKRWENVSFLVGVVRSLQSVMKKALGDTQTLRAGCSKAEPKFAPPAADPFPGAQDGENLINMEMTFTYRSSLVKIDARNFELS